MREGRGKRMMFDDENEENDGLSTLAIGYMWSVRIISLSIQMGLIILGFHWIDRKIGTSPILILVGTLLAIGIFIFQLITMITPPSEKNSPSPSDEPPRFPPKKP